ncbi:LysM-like peptidoglycan-binding domain-containing protein [Acerihabitans arboris]|uniref:Opacity-associated protein A domain protein n=1 Tax=Acerihabitans arboris TaxID=2691583 RepID=A0A845SBY9_9GAMM|nr:LysM-like peptidoglycan-binding domain-containing protein [Acerihabitans arboris]NDL61429.1 Opacity-associated protein A domain protein [Acerihabitans arboris]
MGRTSPGKNKIPRFSLLGYGGFKWKWPLRPLPDEDSNASGRPMLTLLRRVWHLPDGFQWMGPLPLLHRRLVLIAALIIAAAVLWPYSPSPGPAPTPTRATAANGQGTVIQAELVDNNRAAAAPATAPAAGDGQLQHYRIVEGQTLAQLFREHNLPVGDVFAMAQAEGEDKPLSSLRAGQQVEIQQNAQGVVQMLTIETGANSRIRFVRQADGSYLRN